MEKGRSESTAEKNCVRNYCCQNGAELVEHVRASNVASISRALNHTRFMQKRHEARTFESVPQHKCSLYKTVGNNKSEATLWLLSFD